MFQVNNCGSLLINQINEGFNYKIRNIFSHFGYVSRMDNIQAAILNFRIKNQKKIISQRRKNAKVYFDNIKVKDIFLPKEKKSELNTYHTFVIQTKKRDLFMNHK